MKLNDVNPGNCLTYNEVLLKDICHAVPVVVKVGNSYKRVCGFELKTLPNGEKIYILQAR